MASGTRRLSLYSLAVVVLVALTYGGFVYEVDPDPAIFVNAAAEEVRNGLHAQALVEIEKALAIEPDHAYAHVVGAKACEGLGEWDRALAFFERAGTLYPDAERRRALRVSALRVLLLAGRHEALDREAAMLLEHGDDATVRHLLGVSYEERERLEDALASYRAATSVDGNADSWFAAAAVLDRLSRRDEAILALESGLEMDPSRGAAWLALARLRLGEGDRAGAVTALRRGARENPLRIREELRRNPLWNPLKEVEEVANLLAPIPARAPR